MRKNKDERKQSILTAALNRARIVGYTKVTKEHVAETLQCSPGLIVHHFGNMNAFRRAIMGEAIRVTDLTVIAQGISVGDTRALGASQEVRTRALKSLL